MKIDKRKYEEILAQKELRKLGAVKLADSISGIPTVDKIESAKGKYLYEDDEEKGTVKRTIIANTYNWMDSHSDVHLSGVFSKSISERGSKIPHLIDHDFKTVSKVGKILKSYESQISWRELGQGKTGMTEALFIESEIKRSWNERIYNDYKNNEIDQHSVAMQYVKVALAINDEDEYPKEYQVWAEHIGKVGNRAQAEAQGFFFAVSEAKLIEVSAVLLGSNELTPTLGTKFQAGQPLENADEPLKDTRLLEAIKQINYLTI